MVSRRRDKGPSPTGPVLEGHEGYNDTFNIVKTSKEDETIEKLRRELATWMKNEVFDKSRQKDIDLAVVFEPADEDNVIDVDNFVKPVLASLQNHDDDERDRHLIEDDSQIRRLLVHKLKAPDRIEPYDTPRLIVSFREYDPEKQMVMENPGMM